jgi:hypothetical protein
MVAVASLELCRELYELSGWPVDAAFFPVKHSTDKPIPAYHLGYLVRKLPKYIEYDRQSYWFELRPAGVRPKANTWWVACYVNDEPDIPYLGSGEPEDAVCKLAIELFKQGVLTRDGNG